MIYTNTHHGHPLRCRGGFYTVSLLYTLVTQSEQRERVHYYTKHLEQAAYQALLHREARHQFKTGS